MGIQPPYPLVLLLSLGLGPKKMVLTEVSAGGLWSGGIFINSREATLHGIITMSDVIKKYLPVPVAEEQTQKVSQFLQLLKVFLLGMLASM